MNSATDIIKGSVRHSKLVYLVVAVIVAVGIYGLTKINKDEFPTFTIKDGLIVGIYPGATAEQVEQQLTIPLEEFLFSFPEVNRKQCSSMSRDGMCYIFVTLDADDDMLTEIWSKIKLKLKSPQLSLPAGVLAVEVLDDFSSVSSLLISLESTDKGWSEMQWYAEQLSEKLKQIPTLASVSILGTQSEEIAVSIDPASLAAYGINPAMLTLDFQSSTHSFPAGSINGRNIIVNNPVQGEYELAERTVWCDPDGNEVKLKDIATIERRWKKPTSFVSYNGHTSIVLSVAMRPDNNITAFGEDVDKVISAFDKETPESVTITRITDQPKVVNRSVVNFLRDLLVSILVVILVMLVLFPLRSAMIACTGVPVCTATSLAAMYILNIPINMVTLAALIVVLGMIVDDSIITMDGYMENIRKGKRPLEAATESAKELFVPMLMATMAIGAMFFPSKAIISGYLGDFIKYFPYVVSIALCSSLIYAVLVIPSLEVKFIGNAIAEKETLFSRIQNRFFNFLQGIYDRSLEKCFKYPALTIGVGVTAIALGVFFFTKLNIQMVPMAERDLFAIEMELENGNTIDDTKRLSDSLTNILLQDTRVKSVTSFVGSGAPRFHITYSPIIPSPLCSQLIVNTESVKATEELLKECEEKYEHIFPEAIVRFKQMDYQGVIPVMISFKGASLEEMKPYADTLKNFLFTQSHNLKWIHSDFDMYNSDIEVDLIPEKAARLGINKAVTSLSLMGATGSRNIATLWEGKNKIPVNIYSAGVSDSDEIDDLYSLCIPAPLSGTPIPLSHVATLTPEWTPSNISRFRGEEVLTVYADLKYGVSYPDAMKEIDKFIEGTLIPSLPEGIEVTKRGLDKPNETLIPEMAKSFLAAVAILLLFLLLHFRKVSLAVLTIISSLLCLFGASFGLWFMRLDFSITAVLGLISLVGIIVRNGIIMYDYAEELKEKGVPLRDAAMEAGKRRMRPIFLTSCTTALGVLPMIISGDLMWMPMGVCITFGTILSIVLVVLIMPVVYWIAFRRSHRKRSASIAAKALIITGTLVLPTTINAANSDDSHTLTLSQCKEIAMTGNNTIKNAMLEMEAARYQKKELFTEYFPKVSWSTAGFHALNPLVSISVYDIADGASDKFFRLFDQLSSIYGIPNTYQTLNYGFTSSISLMQPIYAGGRIYFGNKLASTGVKAAEVQNEKSVNTTLCEVEQLYWNVVALQEKKNSLDRISTFVDSLYKDVCIAFENGVVTQTDKDRVEIKRNEVANGMGHLKSGIRLAKMNLLNTIGMEYTISSLDSILLTESLDNMPDPSSCYTDEQTMVEAMEEKRLLDLQVEAMELKKRISMGEALPQIAVGASYGYTKAITDRFNGMVYAMVQIPITDWAKTSYKMKREESDIKKAMNDREFYSSQLLLKARKMWVELNMKWDSMKIAEQNMKLFEHILDSQKIQYESGMISLSELLQSQSEYTVALEEFTNARIEYTLALCEYMLYSTAN